MKTTIINFTEEQLKQSRKDAFEHGGLDDDFDLDKHEKWIELNDAIQKLVKLARKNGLAYDFFDFTPVEIHRASEFIKQHCNCSKRNPKYTFQRGELCTSIVIECPGCNENKEITDLNNL